MPSVPQQSSTLQCFVSRHSCDSSLPQLHDLLDIPLNEHMCRRIQHTKAQHSTLSQMAVASNGREVTRLRYCAELSPVLLAQWCLALTSVESYLASRRLLVRFLLLE
jgi:hypothetical protein